MIFTSAPIIRTITENHPDYGLLLTSANATKLRSQTLKTSKILFLGKIMCFLSFLGFYDSISTLHYARS